MSLEEEHGIMTSTFLTIQGPHIVDAQGQPVVLRGFNLGG
jgi:hypothetical protein